MSVNKIVLNTSPLILLCNGKLEFILTKLFSEIAVPTAVWQEIMDGTPSDRAKQTLPKLTWLKKEAVTPVPDVGGNCKVLVSGSPNLSYKC